jgi:antitoxin MazE
MFKATRLQRSGGSSSVILPKHMLDRHHLDAGDRVILLDTEDGILVTPYDPTLAKALEIAERGAKKYHNALLELVDGPVSGPGEQSG